MPLLHPSIGPDRAGRTPVRVTEAAEGLGDPLTHGRMVTKVVPDREPRVLVTCPKYTLLAFSPE